MAVEAARVVFPTPPFPVNRMMRIVFFSFYHVYGLRDKMGNKTDGILRRGPAGGGEGFVRYFPVRSFS
jgi:hypothetical protein